MNEFFKNIIRDKIARIGLLTSVVLSFFSLIFILIKYKNLPPFIPVFNQLPWGEQRLGPTPAIFIPLFTSWTVIILNLIISILIYQKAPLASRMLLTTSMAVSILVFLFLLRTIMLVT